VSADRRDMHVLQKRRHSTLARQLLATLLALTIVACDSQDSQPIASQQSQPRLNSQTDLALSVPQRLRSVSNIDPANLIASAFINGVETELQLNASGQFVGQFPVPARSSVVVALEFYEMFEGQSIVAQLDGVNGLALASAERTVTTATEDATINLGRGEYIFDTFDFDSDGVSNILEREFDSSPINAAETPDIVSLDVFASRPVQAVVAGYNDYDFEVTVANQTQIVAAETGEFRRTFQVLRQNSVEVGVRLVERQTGQRLVVAAQSQSIDNVQDSMTVVFESANYDLGFDQDADGTLDLEQLISGSDINTDMVVEIVDFSVSFPLPPEVPSSASARLTVDGMNVDLMRSIEDEYTGIVSAAAGSVVGVEVEVFDTVQLQALTLATFTAPVQVVAGQTVNLDNFSLRHDQDMDGVFNYLELEQGTDPFQPPVQQCTPVQEEIGLAASDDAHVSNGQLTNLVRIQVDQQQRIGLIRYQYDASLGDVLSAELQLTVGSDAGEGPVFINVVPNLQWSDTDASLALPAVGPLVASMDEVWNINQEYSFQIDPAAVSSDFTLVLTGSDSDDVGFSSNESMAPPILQLTVERCE